MMQEEDEENILFNQADFDNFEDDAADDDKASLLNNQVNKSIQDFNLYENSIVSIYFFSVTCVTDYRFLTLYDHSSRMGR